MPFCSVTRILPTLSADLVKLLRIAFCLGAHVQLSAMDTRSVWVRYLQIIFETHRKYKTSIQSMNCTTFDESIQNIDHAITNDTVIFILFTVFTSIFSLVMLVYGQYIVKTASIIIAAFAVFITIFVFSALIRSIPCIFRIVIACVAAVCAILLTICLFCVGPVLIGGAAFGAGAHYVYTALPLDNDHSPFNLMGQSAYYYITICIAALFGCFVTCYTKKAFMQICSSLIAGAGIAIVVDVVFLRTGTALSSFTFPIVMFSTTAAGIIIQRCVEKRAQTHRRRKRHEIHHVDIQWNSYFDDLENMHFDADVYINHKNIYLSIQSTYYDLYLVWYL